MFFGNSNQDDAARAVENLRGLLQQQEYEFQRLFADLQLTAIGMEDSLTRRKITDAASDTLRGGATNLKHEIRNARHCLGGALDYLQELANVLTDLELNDDWS